MIYFFSMLIIFSAAFIQGAVGFGFSLVAVPLLAIFLPLKEIVPMMVLFSLALNIIVWIKLKGHVDKRKIMVLILLGLVFIPVGILTLKFVKESYIQISVGLLVIVASLAMMKQYKIHFKNPYVAYALTGILSGVLNGATSLSGPPVILMLSNDGVDKMSFRKTLATYFMALNLFSLPMFFLGGMVTKPLLIKSLFIFPSVLIGVLLGILFGNKLNEKIFRKVTLILIFIMGIMTILSGLK